MRVTLMFLPSAIIARMAGTPSGVAGILTKTFGLAIHLCRSLAARIVPLVSWELRGQDPDVELSSLVRSPS
jgi:hypothetical protein